MNLNFNIVTWTPYQSSGLGGTPDSSKRMAIKLDGPFKLSGGLVPDLNTATVPCGEWDKLDDGDLANHGVVEFWFSSSPPTESDSGEDGDDGGDSGGGADHTIYDTKIIDVVPGRMGTVLGDDSPRCIEYKITIADFRHALKFPRGGRLRRGIINPYPTSTPDYEETENDDLLTSAADASFSNGQGSGSGQWDYGDGVSDALSSQENLHNLAWNGSHAPTELGKILDYLHVVASPQSSGQIIFNAIGSGDQPIIPNQLTQLDFSGIDRRGATVVFTSAPVPAYRTWTTATKLPPKFNFVIDQDGSGNWQPIANVLPDGAAAITGGWAEYSAAQKDQYAQQAYRCIQLDTTAYDPSFAKILKQVSIDQQSRVTATIQAKIAIQQKDGTWANSTSLITVTIKNIDCLHNVLILSHRLGTMSTSPGANPDTSFVPLSLTDPTLFQMTITAEDWIPPDNSSSDPMPLKKFFVTGFQQEADNGDGGSGGDDGGSGGGDSGGSDDGGSGGGDGGGLSELSEDDALALIDTPDVDTVILSTPWLVQISQDDDGTGKPISDNRDDLVAKAELLAQAYLNGSGTPSSYIDAFGFVSVETSGIVSAIEWDQEHLFTRVHLNTWWTPSAALSRQKIDEMLASNQFPMQAQTLMQATLMGHSEAVVPTCVPNGIPAAQPAMGLQYVMLTEDGGSGGSDDGPADWTYSMDPLNSSTGTGSMGKKLAPIWAGRGDVGEMIAATAGIAAPDLNGGYVCLIAFETVLTMACASGGGDS